MRRRNHPGRVPGRGRLGTGTELCGSCPEFSGVPNAVWMGAKLSQGVAPIGDHED